MNETKINKNLEESKINKEPKTNNNLEEPKINNNEQSISNNKNSDFVKTPEFLKSKRAIQNPRNNDDKSFQYSITLSSYHEQIGKNYNRVPNIKPYVNNFNWEEFNFPPTHQDYGNIEINNNSIALNILQINDQEEINYLYKSKLSDTRKNKVNLLLLENKHYTSVKNLKSLLS